MFSTFSWLILGLFAVTWGLYWRAFTVKRTRDYRRARTALTIALTGQLGFIIYFTVALGRVPVASVSETLGTLVFLTAAIYWVLEWRLKEYSMGMFILPVLLILLIIGNTTFSGTEPIAPVLKDVKFEIHVLAMLLAYGAFALSFIASLLHTLLAREIQKRELGVFYSRLPSLPFFNRISNASVDIGLLFATLGLALGVYLATQVWGAFLFVDPKFFAAFMTWIIYGMHYLGRRFGYWDGQQAAIISLVAFGWLLFSYLVISMMFTRVHHFT